MKMYNRFIILIIICFSTNVLLSQVNVTLITNPNPPAQLSEWVNQTGLAFFTVNNTDLSLQGSPYKIQVDMYTEDNTLVVTTNNNVITQQLDYLNPQVFNAEDLIPSSALVFPNPSFENTLIQTGMLPAGSYWFCVTVISVNGDFSTLPPQACSFMMVTDYQMPELILPLPNQEISSLSLLATQFNWSPMIPASPQGLKYILAVSEVQNGQTPYQAFLTNFPVIEEETFNTQFFWPPDLDSPTEQTQYIWSVKPVSNDNLPYIQSGNGFVVPETFTVNPMIDLQQNNDTLSLDTICNCMDFKAQFITSIQPFIQQSISSGTFPELTINQPESILYPTKVEIGGVTEIRDYLFDCIDPTTASVVIASADINWSPSSSPENILNNGPFEYQYAVGEQIPDFITVTYRIENTPAYENFLCEKVAWVAVPQSLLDLNNIDNSGTVNIGETVYVGEVINGQGEFECIIDSVTTVNNNHTGKGTVKVPWLASRMAVEFSNITIDSNNNLSSGEVVVESYLTAPDTTQLGSVYVGAVTNFINNNGNYSTPMASFNGALSAINYITTPKKMPFGVMSSKGDSISLVNMVFYNNRSEYDLVALKQTSPKFQSQNIGFKATNVKFSLMNPVSVPERIELVEDVLVGNTNNDIYFYFLAPSSNNVGCYIELDENGFQEFGAEVSAKFTRDWFVPVPDDSISRSTAFLSGVATNWNDFILTGSLEKSEIVSAPGITVLASDISMDLSDVLNPTSIIFPANYVGETTNLFTGFYMDELSVELPNYYETPTGGPIEISATNMIIDNTGLTLMLAATNVIQFNSSKVADLSCGIDTIYITVQSNSLVDSYIKGDIGLPISKADSIQNPLSYCGTLHRSQGPVDSTYFHLTIEPKGPVYAALLKGKLHLEETSNIIAHVGPAEKSFAIDLDGTLTWAEITLGQHTINTDSLPTSGFKFEGLSTGYQNINSNSSFSFDEGAWGFASPQKEINQFPVTVTEISFETLPTSGNELMNGKLNMDVIFNLSSDIGGRTSLGLLASIEDQSSNGGDKFSPQFNGAVIDSIDIQANMAAVSINGTIGFRNNDPVFGNGFVGTLSAAFKAGVTANALAEFGNTNHQHSSLYRYWRVQAEATFPAPGIAFLPGMAFRGFGGGAYNNMDASLNSSGTSYDFTPYKSNFGFVAQTVLATTPKEESFNADCGLLAQFSSSNGITNIGFLGDFYVGASLMPNSRAKAKIIGNVGVTYDFPLKHFNLSANVDVNSPPITTPYPANLVLDINGSTNLWYFKFGEPSHLNTVNVMNISSYEYLTFGNDINPPSGFTSDFSDAYYNLLGSYPSASSIGSGGVGSTTTTGSGFALGIGFTFDSDGDIVLTKYKNNKTKHSLFYDLAGGAELHLSYAEYVGSCGGYTPMGINGWRAKGGLGIYAGAISNVRKYKKSGSIQWDMQVADIRAGAWISGEFPKPSYVEGAIDGVVNLLDLVNFDFHLEFEDGTTCNNSGAVSNVVVTQQDAAADQQNLLIQYVNPVQTHNFPTGSPLVVKYGLVPDDVFDVAEQQYDGTINNRTFKLVVTKSLEMEDLNTGVFNNIPLRTDENNLGEFLYTTSQQTTTGNMQGTSMAGQNISLSGASNTSLSSQLDSTSIQTILSNFTLNFPPSNANNPSILPPEPAPVVNHLVEDRNYKFTVTATLQEYVNNNWVNALSNGSNVTQTVLKSFRTGDIQLVNSGINIRNNN